MGRDLAYILPVRFGAVLVLTAEAEISKCRDDRGLPAAVTIALAAVGGPGTLTGGEQP